MIVAPIASPSPSPSPSPPPSVRGGFSIHGSGTHVFVTQSTGGSGTTPPEGPDFAAGLPNAPMSPYDWFSGAPVVPGVAGLVQYRLTAAYRAPRVTTAATFVLSAIGGDVTNAMYWGEPILGPLDPHQGRSPLPYAIAFPTHAGTDDAFFGQAVLPYSVAVSDNAGRWNLDGGFVDPSAFDAFVFTPPALTDWLPSLDLQTLGSVGPQIADLDAWQHQATTLPLLGVDASVTVGKVAIEATDALLPGPPGTSARFGGVVAALDLGDRGHYSIDVTHVGTSGDAIGVPTLFGSDPTLHVGPQGDLATSTIADQSQTIAGVRAEFHPFAGLDTTVELGRSWYDADLAVRPGSARPGSFEHLRLAHTFGASNDIGVEYYRFDPRYATAILPYGVPENLWGIAWAYPGPWLKGTYQLVGNGTAGVNRVGLRAFADIARGRLDAHAAYYAYRQIEPSTIENLTQTGFVEVDYLAEAPGDSTLGRTQGVEAYVAWRLPRDTYSVDFARDTQERGFLGSASSDYVAMRYPQIVVADEHHFSDAVVAVAGYGRYAAGGMWTTTPVSGIYGLAYLGGEVNFDHDRQQLLVEVRRYGLVGLPSIPGGPAPTLSGTAIILDDHVRF